jgi:hypothetical protein
MIVTTDAGQSVNCSHVVRERAVVTTFKAGPMSATRARVQGQGSKDGSREALEGSGGTQTGSAVT